ncbi:MAG: hypothetical protein A4E72_00005 [Syntrophus sp. PtaU1.Bin208]|nr:MAG: hypothetical protein A4E72_00005 [Syntrophus sp. PtaU1.Bin208]
MEHEVVCELFRIDECLVLSYIGPVVYRQDFQPFPVSIMLRKHLHGIHEVLEALLRHEPSEKAEQNGPLRNPKVSAQFPITSIVWSRSKRVDVDAVQDYSKQWFSS